MTSVCTTWRRRSWRKSAVARLATAVWIALLGVAGACIPPRAPGVPVQPENANSAASIDSGWRVRLMPGAVVRLVLRDERVVTGRMIEQFDFGPQITGDALLVLCVDDRSLCVEPGHHGREAVALERIEALSVRGKRSWFLAQLGVYLGGLGGLGLAAASGEDMDSDTATGGMVLGMALGMTLGAVLGTFSQGWVPVFPCGPHFCAGGQYPSP